MSSAKVVVLALVVLAVASSAMAQAAPAAPAPEAAVSAGNHLGAGLGIAAAAIGAGVAVIGGAMGIGRIGSHATESIARQPEAAGAMFLPWLLTAAMIEGAMLFALVLSYMAITSAAKL